jgi:hypothetical protein
VLPLARSVLTQGRVDSTGGRGSFSGLKDALNSILSDLKNSLITPFKIAEQISLSIPTKSDSNLDDLYDDRNEESPEDNERPPESSQLSTPSIDLLINGVWAPVTSLLAEKFPNIFSGT